MLRLYFVSSVQRKFLSIARIAHFFDSVIAVDNLINHPMKGKANTKNSVAFISVANDYFLVLFLKCMHFTKTLGPNSNRIKNDDGEEREMVCKRRCSEGIQIIITLS